MAKLMKQVLTTSFLAAMAICSPLTAHADTFLDNWEVAVSAGYGQRTNPLINADDIDTFLNIDISWYGDRFFFDNGDIGYNLFFNDKLSINLLGQLSKEGVFFDNVFSQGISIGGAGAIGSGVPDPMIMDPAQSVSPTVPSPEAVAREEALPVAPSVAELPLAPTGIPAPAEDPGNPAPDIAEQPAAEVPSEEPSSDSVVPVVPPVVEPFEVTDRNYAYEAGIEVVFDSGFGQFQFSALQDVTSQHNGQRIDVSYSTNHISGRWIVQPAVGLSWRSDQLANYYFGVDASEATAAIPNYEATASINHFGRIVVRYAISKNLFWGTAIEYEQLGDEIANSPIVVEDTVVTAYTGIKYRF